MLFARLASVIRLTIATLFLRISDLRCRAQEPPAAPVPQNRTETRPLPLLDYTKPASHFPNPIAPILPRHVRPAEPGEHVAHRSVTARRQTLPLAQRCHRASAGEQSRYRHRPLQLEYRRYRRTARQGRRGNSRHAQRSLCRIRQAGGVGGIGATAGASTRRHQLGAGGIGAGTNGLVSSTLGLGPLITL